MQETDLHKKDLFMVFFYAIFLNRFSKNELIALVMSKFFLSNIFFRRYEVVVCSNSGIRMIIFNFSDWILLILHHQELIASHKEIHFR